MKTNNIILVAPIKSLIVFFLGESGFRKAQISFGHTILVIAELISAFLIMIVFSPIIIMVLILDFIRNNPLKKFINRLISIYHLRKKAKQVVDRNQAINAIANDHAIFKYLTRFHSDPKVVKEAIKKRTQYIQYASKDLRDNEELIKYMMNQYKHRYNNYGFKYVSSRLRNNKKIAHKGVKYNILNLKYIKRATKNDRKFLINVFKFNRSNFSDFTLSLIPQELRHDKYLLQLIINKMPKIIFDINFPQLNKSNLSLIILALNISPEIYGLLPPQLRAKKSLLMAAILSKNNKYIWKQAKLIHKAPAILRSDLDIAKASFKKDASAFELFNYSVKINKEICYLALRKDINCYRYFPKQILRDSEIIDYIYKIGFLNRLKGNPLLNAKGIKLLLKNGKDPEKIYTNSLIKQRRYKCLYVKAINAKPKLITLEKNINYLLKIDFSKLNLNARRMCYTHFKTLYSKSNKEDDIDILEVANSHKQVAKKMLLQEEIVFLDEASIC
tara:strand:+ start:3204 stop:4706 length:1503 start_codon:yes stop_codon:yes gene_type:complete